MTKIQDIVLRFRKAYALRKAYLKQKIRNGNQRIRFYNWNWGDEPQIWFSAFIQNSDLGTKIKKNINFCTVFGIREVLRFVTDGVKIFFSGENLHLSDHEAYKDGLLNDKNCNLSLGFDCKDDVRYVRFPLWLTYVFEPTMDEQKIHERCEQLRYPKMGNRDKFACLIARADISGIRTAMYDGLEKIGKVDCPSDLFHNDESLKQLFGDNKVEYMHQYLFNICPENSNAKGYCTEKVFEAIAAGCIPVYWGDGNNPEPGILNPDAIIFWDVESHGARALQQIQDLYSNHTKLEEFLKQPRLLPSAEKKITGILQLFCDRIRMAAEK